MLDLLAWYVLEQDYNRTYCTGTRNVDLIDYSDTGQVPLKSPMLSSRITIHRLRQRWNSPTPDLLELIDSINMEKYNNKR